MAAKLEFEIIFDIFMMANRASIDFAKMYTLLLFKATVAHSKHNTIILHDYLELGYIEAFPRYC